MDRYDDRRFVAHKITRSLQPFKVSFKVSKSWKKHNPIIKNEKYA